MANKSPIRMGILGAAKIAPAAVIRPARQNSEVEIAAVAARDPAKAQKFARKQGIPKVHKSYEDLLADPGINAIYNPLPNGLHAEWSIRAMEAGKDVLCEKPMASNAAEAEQMLAVAEESGRHLYEAFHYRYHPLAIRMKEVVDSGEIGRVQSVEARFAAPFIIPNDIRFDYDLAGGATMDLGCYTINMMRYMIGKEPRVDRAKATLSSPQVDRAMSAEMTFPDNIPGKMFCSLFSRVLLSASLVVQGDNGRVNVFNPMLPHMIYHRLKIETPQGSQTEKFPGDSTYTYQLKAFANAILRGESMPTDGRDAVANMRVIDAVYEAAGLKIRGG